MKLLIENGANVNAVNNNNQSALIEAILGGSSIMTKSCKIVMQKKTYK